MLTRGVAARLAELAVVAVAVAASGITSGQDAACRAPAPPAIRWDAADPGVVTKVRKRAIDLIVLHKAEGSLSDCIAWFKDPLNGVSAHYCVDEREIVQMVRDEDVAWHAGNWKYNERSIGIENSGYNAKDDLGDAHYRKLASLVASLCAKHGIPVDRDHIIGHDEVPDPFHKGRFGGANHHTCPGTYFDWTLFLRYVREASSP
jgi:N-acetyl-anhydromuramyl-L-alanine amidase AmpD